MSPINSMFVIPRSIGPNSECSCLFEVLYHFSPLSLSLCLSFEASSVRPRELNARIPWDVFCSQSVRPDLAASLGGSGCQLTFHGGPFSSCFFVLPRRLPTNYVQHIKNTVAVLSWYIYFLSYSAKILFGYQTHYKMIVFRAVI